MKRKLFSILVLQTGKDGEKPGTLSEFSGNCAYRVDKVRGFGQANVCLDRRTYDILLIDFSNISVGESLDLIQRVLSLNICLITVSDHVDKKLSHYAPNLGMSGVLSKPVDPVLLEELICRCTKDRRNRPATAENRSRHSVAISMAEDRLAVA